jgi:hypothetical protein
MVFGTGRFKKELYYSIPNVAVWRVLRKRLHLKAYKLFIVQHLERLIHTAVTRLPPYVHIARYSTEQKNSFTFIMTCNRIALPRKAITLQGCSISLYRKADL